LKQQATSVLAPEQRGRRLILQQIRIDALTGRRPWAIGLGHAGAWAEQWAPAWRLQRKSSKMLIVAEDEDAEPGSFTLAPRFLAGCKPHGGVRTLTKVL
jgi:hypothetical protein